MVSNEHTKARGATRTVLIVDDEPQVLKTAAQALEMAGYRTLTASSAAEAERICTEHEGPIDALVMDVVLRDTHGFDAVPCLRAIRKQLAVLYISGYPGQLLYESQGIDDPFLFKPFTPVELVEAVDLVLAKQPARAA